MSVEEKHPDYLDREPEWKLMRETIRGSKAVKAAREEYLPMPSGFKADGANGRDAYTAYINRATFPRIVSPTVRGMVGIIHKVEAQVTLPPALEPLQERATKQGLPLEIFHRKITDELLSTGRYGVLCDLPTADDVKTSDIPWLAGYTTEGITNWAEDGTFFVLDESGKIRIPGTFGWTDQRKFRVLELVNGKYQQRLFVDGTERLFQPNRRGAAFADGGGLDEIPFNVAGPTELAVKPDNPPLLGVAENAIRAYQLDADYRHQLFSSGQETLFISGLAKNDPLPTIIGATAVHGLPANAKAEYVAPSGRTIAAHKIAIDDALANATSEGARLFDGAPQGAEAAEAMKIRFAAKTASLVTIAIQAAALLERALRQAAVFVGADPNDVIVKPNLKLVEATLTAADGVNLMKMWQGRAISYTTMYENMQRGGMASEERTSDEEQGLIEDEAPEPPPDPTAGLDPNATAGA